ncbi:MAG: hypothetical protein ACLRWQ_20270 [Flavonifractor plautii]
MRTVRRAFTSGMILRQSGRREGAAHRRCMPQALERLAGRGLYRRGAPAHPHHERGRVRQAAAPRPSPFRDQALPACPLAGPSLTTLEDYAGPYAASRGDSSRPGGAGHRRTSLWATAPEHYANAAYCQLEYMLHDLGRTDAVLGTVEGYPGLE